jgi:two-component system sensor histidine kinase KdpD
VADETRPDPDALLASIQKQETKAQRGRLKIFFGMCPGVGKTYAMLQAAREKHLAGVEVVAGIVETHGRADTMALLEGVPIAERLKVEYRGAVLEEMDLDGLLLWHPKLVLVDELAHTNAPGSRHPKRYQDVLELLDAGIDVYATLNVQHVESRKDTVAQITGVTVRETVPDSILDVADEVALIDLTPGQLQKRLAEGKVYLGERAATAAENFFRESNLMALREMSLRLTAEHVDRDLRTLRQAQLAGEPWKAGERLMVAVSPSPSSEKLIRWTRRAAASMEASWLVVNVETPRALSALDEVKLALNITLARQLGADVVMTDGVEIGPALLRVARQHNVSQIIVGKPGPRPFFARLKNSPVDWLVRHSGDIDVHMVRAEAPEEFGKTEAAPPSPQPWREYGACLLVAAGVTLLGLAVESVTGYWAIALVYLLAVIVAATRIRRRPTLFLAALSAMLWNFLFIPPKYTLYIREVRDVMMFAMYFIVALIVGHLTARLREREEMERRGEARASALYRLTRALASCQDTAATVAAAVRELREAFSAECALLLRDEGGVFTGRPHPAGATGLSEKEEGVAAWVFQKRQPAGRFTDTLPDAEALHLPLIAGKNIEGVLAVKLPGGAQLSTHQRGLLDAFAAQIALAAEKDRLAQASRKAQVAAQSEQLQRALFDTVSHELKTPLAAINAALEQPMGSDARDEIRQAVTRLESVVNNLLDMTRLESGLLKPNLEWCDVAELLGTAASRAAAATPQHEVKISAPGDLAPVRVDAGLAEQAVALIIANAANYSPAGSPVEVAVSAVGENVTISVSDHGPGLAPGEETRVFEKFYRAANAPKGGLGLGLSIAQRLVQAHGGEIIAHNRADGTGTIFTIRLPVGGKFEMPEEQA